MSINISRLYHELSSFFFLFDMKNKKFKLNIKTENQKEILKQLFLIISVIRCNININDDDILFTSNEFSINKINS
jgi:hypothetical protein